MSGGRRAALDWKQHRDHAPGRARPRVGGETAPPLVELQRLAGNEATGLVIQRLDEEDEESLLEAAKFVANPLAYAGSKTGEWLAKKIKEQGYDPGVVNGGDGEIAGAVEPFFAGDTYHDFNQEHGGEAADHIIGGAKGSGAGAPSGGAGPGEPTGGDPLVGLQPGDGLAVGTWRRRPRVKLLQYRLNRASGAGLAVDGMWGKRTTAALEAFQLSRGMVPVPTVDAATSAALQSPMVGRTDVPAEPGGSSRSLPDISGQVAPDVIARWQSALVFPPGSAVPPGSGVPPEAPRAQAGAAFPTHAASSLVGTSGGGMGDVASSKGIRTDAETLARFEQYKPVLYDMWYRYDRAARDTEAYFALLQQSAAVAGYWAARAFSSICASLAGIVLGPPGLALWTIANQFWGLGARAAEEAERPILEAATAPALEAIVVFGNVVQQSFDNAYPMRTPDMPWYIVGSGWIQGPTASLINAYGQVQRLRRY